MAKRSSKKVAFVSTSPPQKCGIATFTSDLIKNTGKAAGATFEPLVVAIRQENLKYGEPVKFEVRRDVKNDYLCAANYINFSHVSLVCLQHEFGLFGGPAGSYIDLMLQPIKAPIITTLHTILDAPEPAYYKSLVNVCKASDKVITMNRHGIEMLQDIYKIPSEKIELIPHGIPDLPFVDSNYYKHHLGMEGRKTILTFGLMSKDKGIEVMLRAMPQIIKVEPTILYIILGATHPSVLKHDGESYRFKLQRMVKELGLQEHVIFHNRFVDDDELHNFLCASDIYVTPYSKKEQLTSGTLAFAVGTGKTVVSTPYWAAEELLSDGRGKLVPFGDSEKMAESIIEVIQDTSLCYSLRRKAYDYGRTKTWPRIGQSYWKLFTAKKLPARLSAKAVFGTAETIPNIELPEPSLEHLKRLTDDTGLLQHAKFTIPNLRYGYATDDNARAVVTITKYYLQHPEPEVLRLLDKYLSFTLHAQNTDGTVKNIMKFDRTWLKNEPVNDALGRLLWALGTVIAMPPLPSYLPVIKDRFDRSAKLVENLYPRGMAYSILGMADYLKQFPGASDIKRTMITAADKLIESYEKNSRPDWLWFEECLTYDNAVLPHALFAAASVLENENYRSIAGKTCNFLLEKTFLNGHFSFIGCNGWYKRSRQRANFDQQPIEAVSTVMMLGAAYEMTQQKRFIKLQRKAFDWFLGENDLNMPLYDFRTKGCNDGLMPEGVNINQGAESTLSFLLSLLVIIEGYAIVDKVAENTDVSQKKTAFGQADNVEQTGKKAVPIKSVFARMKSEKKHTKVLRKPEI